MLKTINRFTKCVIGKIFGYASPTLAPTQNAPSVVTKKTIYNAISYNVAF